MIDFTDRNTLATIQAALRRALNSLDHEIGVVDFGLGLTPSQRTVKLALLNQSRDDMRRLYDGIIETVR